MSCITNLSAQTGSYAGKLWSPTLVALILHVEAQRAAFLLMFVNLAGFLGRIFFSSSRIGSAGAAPSPSTAWARR